MSEKSNAAAGTDGTFKLAINVGSHLPGTPGQPIYASATVDAVGTQADAPSNYLLWENCTGGIASCPVTLVAPSSTAAASSPLTGVVTTPVSTTIGTSFPAMVSTTITEAVPALINTTINTTTGITKSFSVADSSGIRIGMTPFGGIHKGNVFTTGCTVTDVNGTTITISADTITGVVASEQVTFTGAAASSTIEVDDTAGILAGMIPSGGMNGAGNGFQPETTVRSVNGNSVLLSEDTYANVIAEGASVTFSTVFTAGTTTVEVASTSGITPGMIVSGGRTSGNAFSATTRVVTILSATKLTLSEASLDEIVKGAAITFTPETSAQIEVASPTGITVGMSVRGGTAEAGGNAFAPDTFVSAIEASSGKTTITISEPALISGLSVNKPVSFYSPVPSVQIGTIGQESSIELLIPADQVLAGGRIIFTLEKPGNLPFNSANRPIAPVPYKGNVTELYYDFVEFAWTLPKAGETNLNYDTSIVDQFGLPITIGFEGEQSTSRGIYIDRGLVFSQYESFVPASIAGNIAGSASPSSQNVTAFFSGLATVMAPYRILAPADAFLLAAMPNPPAAATSSVNDISRYFDTVIKTFFDTYDQTLNPGSSFKMSNVSGVAASGKAGSGLHDLSGVVTMTGQKGTDGQSHNYRVLQLTDITVGINSENGLGWVYNIYEPFFSSNGYPDRPSPPSWLTNGDNMATTATPTEMVFGASGVFADSDINGNQHPTPASADTVIYQTLLGAMENQIVTAINRGILLAPQWRWLYQSADNSATQTPQVTVNKGTNTITIAKDAFVPVYVGMSVVQQQSTPAYIGTGSAAAPNVVTAVDFNSSGETTITLSMHNEATEDTSDVLLNFSYNNIANPFYQQTDPMAVAPFNSADFHNNGVWNYFSQFFHIPVTVSGLSYKGVSIHGLAYAYAFDDQGNFSTDISKDNPAEARISFGLQFTL